MIYVTCIETQAAIEENSLDPMQSHPCVYVRDIDRLIDLVRAYRMKTGVAVYPTTWRVRLLLTSRVWNPGQDVCIWETPSGEMTAFAMLWRRHLTSPYLALERFIHPSFASRELAADLLAWGSQRAEAIACEQGFQLSLYSPEFASSLHLDSPFAEYGFTPLKPNPDGFNLYFGRSLREPLSEPVLSPGFILRPVQGTGELNTYRAMSSFAAVNPDHLQELFESDEYSHLVAVAPEKSLAAPDKSLAAPDKSLAAPDKSLAAPDRSLAGYCECSIDRAEWQACEASGSFTGESIDKAKGPATGLVNGPRIGWIDYIETRPEYQGKGLGQALLWAGLRRLQAWGAETAMLITISTNAPAVRLYTKAGFERVAVREPVCYEKHI